ncbi:MAG: hypothetical protein ABIH71_05735 [Candidatus Omnitrophota bacterium]
MGCLGKDIKEGLCFDCGSRLENDTRCYHRREQDKNKKKCDYWVHKEDCESQLSKKSWDEYHEATRMWYRGYK